MRIEMMKRLYILIFMLMFGASTAWAGSYNILNPRYGQTAHPREHIIKCVIDTSKIGAVGGVVTNFPVLVDTRWITQYDSLESATDRADVHFVSSTWGALKFDREQGNKNIYHVKVPAPYTASYFYMCYGDRTRSDGANPTAVWDANYVMVQHMADSTTSVTSDATSNGNIGTKKGANEPLQAAGKIGYGQTFDGSDDYNNAPNSATLLLANTSLTLSAWVKTSSATQQGIFSHYNYNAGETGYLLHILANGRVQLKVSANGVGFTYNEGTTSDVTTLNDGLWHHIVAVWDYGVGFNIYIDGALTTSNPMIKTGDITLSTTLGIGRGDGYYGGSFNGTIDEVRISNIARSAAWELGTFNSLNGTLLSYTTVK